jgi:hypothetical protein
MKFLYFAFVHGNVSTPLDVTVSSSGVENKGTCTSEFYN